jgi:hypothetical protein
MEAILRFRERIRQGHREADKLQLWREESWTPLLFYIHVKHFSVGVGLGFALGVCVSALICVLSRLPA